MTYLGIVEKKDLVICEIQAGKVGLLSVLLNPLLVGSVGLGKIIYKSYAWVIIPY